MVDVIGRARVIVESDIDSASVSNVGTKMGNLLSGALKTGVVGAAAGIGTLIGGALFKGFSRLSAIEEAEAKLKGFGNSAKDITKIMENANAAVKGTAFGLGEAATVAAQAVAAGIKPGKELEGILKTVANNAAGAGTSLEDMGSIFAKAMTQANGVQNDVIGQLSEKGIPIYQELAELLGVTAGEVFDLASQGEISFPEFAEAAKNAAGTVADEMGNTVSGSLENLGAAIGRLGAAFLGESFETFPDLINHITEKMNDLEPAARKVGKNIRDIIDQIERWANSKLWKELKESMAGWGEDLLVVAGALASIVKAMAALTPKGTGGGLLDFLIKLEEHTTPLKVVADLIRTIQNAAAAADKNLSDFLSIGPIRVNPDKDAVGGPAGGLTLVGERGPELLQLPAGSYVHSAINTQEMLAAASGGGDTFNITHIGNVDGLIQKINWSSRYRRVGV